MTMPCPLGLCASFGFGDRLGSATAGHISAVRGTGLAPVFAQQSVRENLRTGRNPQQVLDDARRAIEAAGWESPWGADADHLKDPSDLPAFVAAGYSLFTVDPGEHVDHAAAFDPLPVLEKKAAGVDRVQLEARYLETGTAPWCQFDRQSLLRAAVKYGRAIEHTHLMYRSLSDMLDHFDFEVSVDETETPTTPQEHFFIASELTRLGIQFTALAPRFSGRFEKGVDYIGDLAALDAEMQQHAAVTTHFGTYKVSLHSGSDKFSVYPLLTRHWGKRLHVKTAGTSYLEALRLMARLEPVFFRQMLDLARERYPLDRLSYHVSAELDQMPPARGDESLPALLDDFHAREVLHVTFGSLLAQFGSQLRTALSRHAEAYRECLRLHFMKHLDLLRQVKDE